MSAMRTAVLACLLCCAHPLVADNVTDHVNWHLFDHEKCGQSSSDRIIGGELAHLGQYPWMARLGYIKPYKGIFEVRPKGFKCGSSLINNMYVITAAHCVSNLNGDILAMVRLGEHDTRTNIDCEFEKCAPPVQDFTPSEVVVHKDYDKNTLRNDIALIRLDKPAKMHNYVSAICLPHGSLMTKDFVGSKMEVAGWGVEDVMTSATSPTLMTVRVPVVDNSFCQRSLRDLATVRKGQFCAGAVVGHDSCGGDSGGPLMRPEAPDGLPRYYLFGVVSFGSTKCGSELPAVYTEVRLYMKWILDNVEP